MKRSLRRVIAAFLLLGLTALPFLSTAEAKDDTVTINVYNWGQYISDGTDGAIDVNKAFTEATGIEVNYMTFDSNETMYTKLKTGGSSYDVIIPSDYMVGRLIDEGMLMELDFNNIPNYQYVGEGYKNTDYDPENKYSVPYTWGTVGVIYNSKYVDEADTGSWDLMWNEKYSGKILMFSNPRDAFGIAELKLGYSISTTDRAELDAAAEALRQQKPVVQDYVMDQIFTTLEHEEAWIGAYYAGDYLMMAQENPDLKFYFPEEGFNKFIDAMCIPTCCQNKAAAEAYINFLCDPEISGQNLDYLGYSTPIDAAKEYMDPEVASSPIAYPDVETLKKGQTFLFLDAETNQYMDSLWLTVRTTGSSNTLLLCIIGLVVIIAVCVFFVIRKNKKKKRRKALYTK